MYTREYRRRASQWLTLQPAAVSFVGTTGSTEGLVLYGVLAEILSGLSLAGLAFLLVCLHA